MLRSHRGRSRIQVNFFTKMCFIHFETLDIGVLLRRRRNLARLQYVAEIALISADAETVYRYRSGGKIS
jgi:hypothetical protein